MTTKPITVDARDPARGLHFEEAMNAFSYPLLNDANIPTHYCTWGNSLIDLTFVRGVQHIELEPLHKRIWHKHRALRIKVTMRHSWVRMNGLLFIIRRVEPRNLNKIIEERKPDPNGTRNCGKLVINVIHEAA